jgi:hypothetical protein
MQSNEEGIRDKVVLTKEGLFFCRESVGEDEWGVQATSPEAAAIIAFVANEFLLCRHPAEVNPYEKAKQYATAKSHLPESELGAI